MALFLPAGSDHQCRILCHLYPFSVEQQLGRFVYYVSQGWPATGNMLVRIFKRMAVPRFEIVVAEDSVAALNQAEIKGAVIHIEVNIDEQRNVQASRERPVSGHGQVRESVENGGGRPARYALARRR
jgi:hypothetical protein